MSKLGNMGEDELVSLLTRHSPINSSLITGPGDDCAVAQFNDDWDLLLKTDCIVSDIHFTLDMPPELIGRKALARALSDIAAMGGIPEHALITVICHEDTEPSLLIEAYKGISSLAEEFHVSLAGGETSSLPRKGLIFNVSLSGKVPRGKAVLRSTAREGDLIAVTGELGGSFSSSHHLTFVPRLEEARLLLLHEIPTAMMDLSDGLGTDLPRLAKSSNLGFHLNTGIIPCRKGCSIQQSLSDGEDYELLFTLSPGKVDELKELGKTMNLPITIIGSMTEGPAPGMESGWRHFSSLPR